MPEWWAVCKLNPQQFPQHSKNEDEVCVVVWDLGGAFQHPTQSITHVHIGLSLFGCYGYAAPTEWVLLTGTNLGLGGWFG
jgi:hypothetical protein